jgi:hypothetical protein
MRPACTYCSSCARLFQHLADRGFCSRTLNCAQEYLQHESVLDVACYGVSLLDVALYEISLPICLLLWSESLLDNINIALVGL